LKVSIIGRNQVIGLEDMIKDKVSFRIQKVTCVSEKASVYFLAKEDYFIRFYKFLMKSVVAETNQLKQPFF